MSSSRILQRVVKHFDFDEEPLGNFEPTPMNWEPFAASGYPPFLRVRFDKHFGHDAPPSIWLPVSGGSIATRYATRGIPVHPESSYRISAWVRTRNLVHARAQLSAVYLDRALRALEATSRVSRAVNDAEAGSGWTRLDVVLPSGEREARWVGLTLAVTQPEARGAVDSGAREIIRHDVNGGCWFDDLRIERLPQIAFGATDDSLIRLSDEPASIHVRLADVHPADLQARLDVFDARGTRVLTRRIRAGDARDPGEDVALGNPPVGWYRAVLTVRSENDELSRHERVFLRVSPDLPEPQHGGSFIGLTLDGSRPHASKRAALELVRWLGIGAVKIPVWRSNSGDDEIVYGDDVADDFISTIREQGAQVVGVLEAPPASLAARFPRGARDLHALLAEPPDRWRAYLALPLVRLSGRVDVWQIGEASSADVADEDGELRRQAIDNVSREVRRLARPATLSVPWPIRRLPATESALIDVVDLSVESRLATRALVDAFRPFSDLGRSAVWASIAEASPRHADHADRYAALAKTMIVARQSGSQRVFVAAPWREAVATDRPLVPDEAALVLRTLSALIGRAIPQGPLDFAGDVEAYLFRDSTSHGSILALWTDAIGGATELCLPLGDSVRQFDLWGRSSSPAESDGLHCVRIGTAPTFVTFGDARRLRLLAGVSLVGGPFETATSGVKRTLVVSSPTDAGVRGRIRVAPLPGWQVGPREFPFALDSNGRFAAELSFDVPRSATGGHYEFPVRIIVEGSGSERISAALRAEVRLVGIDVSVFALWRDEGFIIQQRIANRGSAPADLTSVIISPHHPRQMRQIVGLEPGRTTVIEDVLPDAAALRGKIVRVSIRRADGLSAYHHDIRVDEAPLDDGRSAEGRPRAAEEERVGGQQLARP